MEKKKVYEIYNRAISLINIDPKSNADWDADTDSKERILCDMWFKHAIDKIRIVRAWTFLQEELSLGDDEGAVARYLHSYQLPYDMYRLCSVVYADGVEDENHFSQYRLVNNYLLSEKPVKTAYGMLEELPLEGIPEDFYVAISYQLAMLIAPAEGIAQDTINIINGYYVTLLNSMIMNEMRFNRRDRIDGR